jgi:hypothetical protein
LGGLDTYRPYIENVEALTNYEGENLLQKMYEAKEMEEVGSPWPVRLQTKIIIDLMEQDTLIKKNLPDKLCVQERDHKSLFHVFLPAIKEHVHPVDYSLLMDLLFVGQDINNVPTKKNIFLYADKLTCYLRMQQRNRDAEMEMSLHTYHALATKMDSLRHSANFVLDTTHLNQQEVVERVNDYLKFHS